MAAHKMLTLEIAFVPEYQKQTMQQEHLRSMRKLAEGWV